jgi:hypothetical protein
MNYVEDLQRAWGKIKMTISLSSEISAQEFADHYGENWQNALEKLDKDEYNISTHYIINIVKIT